MDIFHVMRYKEKSDGGFGGEGIREINGVGVFLYISWASFRKDKFNEYNKENSDCNCFFHFV